MRLSFLSDGKDNASWAVNLKSENFELLCPSGGRAAVDKYESCNLLQSPPHMVSFSARFLNYFASKNVVINKH